MTKNNLKPHLSWLLNAKPFVPPAGPPIVHPISDSLPSSAAAPTLDSHSEVSTPLAGHAPLREPPRSQSVVPEFCSYVPEPRRDNITSAITLDPGNTKPHSHALPTDMAKLRAAPGSTSKPRLISQAHPDLTPLAGAIDRFKSKLASASSGTSRQCAGKEPSAHASQSKGKGHAVQENMQFEDWDMDDVDAIDLTGDSETRTASSPSIHVPSSTSRKRKSDQFEPPSEDSPAPRRPRVQARRAGVPAADGFAPIEDFEDPPPPYSTVAHRPYASSSTVRPGLSEEFEDPNETSALDADDEGQQRVSESPFKPVPKKRKPLSRVPSENTELPLGAVTLRKASRSPNKVNWSIRDQLSEEPKPSPTKRSHQKKRRIVADSEDEDDFDVDDRPVQLNLRISPSKISHPELQSPAKPSGLKPTTIDKSKDFRWHECKDNQSLLARPRQQPQKSVGKDASPILSKMYSASAVIEDALATPSSGQASPALHSKKERLIVSSFGAWPEEYLQNVCRGLETEVLRLKRAQTEYLETYEIPSRDLIEQSKSALKRKGVIESLIENRHQLERANTRKKELSDRILSLMDTEYSTDLTEFDETTAAIKLTGEQIKNIEVEMIRLMKAAGFVDGEGESARLHDRPQFASANVVVRSTQADPGKHQLQEATSAMPTQRVQQTQIPCKSPATKSTRETRHLVPRDAIPRRDSEELDDAYSEYGLSDASFANIATGTPEERVEMDFVSGPSSANPQHGSSGPALLVDEHDFQDDDNLFSTNMGTPPAQVVEERVVEEEEEEEEEDYGDLDDLNDEDMLDITEEIGNNKTAYAVGRSHSSREAFQEASGNPIRQQLPRDKAAKKHNAKVSGVMAPPANQPQFSWTSDVKRTLKDRFRLRGFRPHQLEAINATLGGKDCFVLMPTGGGKSLCYQLPAVIQTGKTRGVTVVISPLLSLMEDQVNHLRKLNIQAFHINGELNQEERQFIMNALRESQAEKFIQVLYVTPEMLSKSQAMINVLKDLHRRQRLARIVIDEAHCVSQWGHDFRPDYKTLGEIRRQFLGVPVMALTATATENVKVDTIHNLGIEGCEVFAQSFNRPNLYYDVRTKGKREDILQNIADIIKTQYRGKSGIVYCLARKKCELIAEQLRVKHGISAQHYHAGMEPAQKSETQKAWQAGTYKVIVATIAFGMGIDKPDVRFVIHHSIPKSLEGYYQETGRAGRDGKRSGCHLFYGYQDTAILKKMIDEGEGSRQQKERQYAMLRNVVQFCENKADCRRVQVLAYFNEAFKAEECDAECDNCNSTITFEYRDFTDLAAAAINLVGRIQTEKVTLLHCVDVFRGSSSKKIKELGHDSLTEYGSGSELDRGDAERLFQRLVSEDALEEDNRMNRAGFASQYIKLGRNCRIFQARKKPVQIHVRVSPRQVKGQKTKNAATKRKGTGVAAARDDYPFSTNVSSPLQIASRVSRKTRVVDMDDDRDGFNEGIDAEAEDESEAFEAPPQPRTRMIAKSSKNPRQKFGAPITTDEKMAALDELHQDVVEEFVREGRSECQKILIARNLRSHPFTDTVLREMAISFPATQRELMSLPGVDAQMVTLYGERFLKLVKRYKNNFESMTGQHLQQADKVKDPNHEIIEISDEDEEDDDAQFEDEVDLDAEESSEECRSSYFRKPEVDPELEAFNVRYSQAQTSTRSAATPAAGRAGRSAAGARRYSSGQKAYPRRKGSRKSSTGYAKKVTGRKRDSGGGAGGSSKPSRKGGGGGFGIAAMPT
ncbi:family helicase [Diplodia corticola]|uniref:DNA 3'-5' helicase n=1 Tax=Diplodia corticola TaxID=236234 RepID=A0A1J9RZ53_9PEZI|nr:family helicase [Diplodia corticola]OJD37955.1 family helicase [Diplodia corticola]